MSPSCCEPLRSLAVAASGDRKPLRGRPFRVRYSSDGPVLCGVKTVHRRSSLGGGRGPAHSALSLGFRQLGRAGWCAAARAASAHSRVARPHAHLTALPDSSFLVVGRKLTRTSGARRLESRARCVEPDEIRDDSHEGSSSIRRFGLQESPYGSPLVGRNLARTSGTSPLESRARFIVSDEIRDPCGAASPGVIEKSPLGRASWRAAELRAGHIEGARSSPTLPPSS